MENSIPILNMVQLTASVKNGRPVEQKPNTYDWAGMSKKQK